MLCVFDLATVLRANAVNMSGQKAYDLQNMGTLDSTEIIGESESNWLRLQALADKRTQGNPTPPHTVAPSLPHTAEPSLPHTVEPSLPHTVEPSLPHTVEPSLSHTAAPSLSHTAAPLDIDSQVHRTSTASCISANVPVFAPLSEEFSSSLDQI